MVHLKSKAEVERIRVSCRIAADAMVLVRDAIAPGVTTAALDEIAADHIRSQGGVASALGYRGYPRSICVSINEEVVHGIPGSRQLLDGDILSVDIAVIKDGYHGDMNVSFAIGTVSDDAARLMQATREAMDIGLHASQPGARLGDIGAAIQQHVEWIARAISHLDDNGLATMETTDEVAEAWVEHVNAVADRTLFPTCNSWYLGSNIPGKPRVFTGYVGWPEYAAELDDIVKDNYRGFRIGKAGA